MMYFIRNPNSIVTISDAAPTMSLLSPLEKLCKKCRHSKILTEFDQMLNNPSSLQSNCRTCKEKQKDKRRKGRHLEWEKFFLGAIITLDPFLQGGCTPKVKCLMGTVLFHSPVHLVCQGHLEIHFSLLYI
jgi:hypothetical protein